MKKILWFSNYLISASDIKSTGSWLQPMAEGLVNDFNIIVVAFGNVIQPEKQHIKGITQWIIPKGKLYDNGQTISKEIEDEVLLILEKEKPDLIHIWGTEGCWASFFINHNIYTKKILEIQGLLYRCATFYYGSLTLKDIIKCIHFKELIMPWRTLFNKKRIFYKRGEKEKQYISKFDLVACQSEWVKNSLSYIVPKATIFSSKILLRDEFYKAEQWQFKDKINEPVIFSSASAAIPYKGIHQLILSLFYAKKNFPDIKLRLAGNMNVGNRLMDGYSIYLQKLIGRYKLENNIVYLGSLNATQIIDELQRANVCVIPSFVETYCLALAEAMIIGCPIVCAFAGAMPEQADNNKEVLFYDPEDAVQCAAQIEKIIKNKELAISLSEASVKRKRKDNNKEFVINNQIQIYNTILKDNF